jgi:hypothetical protein
VILPRDSIYEGLTFISLILNILLAFIHPYDLLAKNFSSSSQEQKEGGLLSSLEYAEKLLTKCHIAEDQKSRIKAQLDRATNLVKLQHNLNDADLIFKRVNNQLVDCPAPINSTAPLSPPGSPGGLGGPGGSQGRIQSTGRL